MKLILSLFLMFIGISLKASPMAYFYLQPYGDFSQKEAQKVGEQLIAKLKKTYDGAFKVVKILPNKSLPSKAYYKPKNRYLANELLKDLPDYSFPVYVIGLTHKDISYKIHGHSNYGIMGLTPRGYCKSIISDYRIKGQNFVKVIIHEIGHGLLYAKHCKNPNCIMCDFSYLKNKSYVLKLCKAHSYM